jgi:hypothetical protein
MTGSVHHLNVLIIETQGLKINNIKVIRIFNVLISFKTLPFIDGCQIVVT